MRNRIIVLDTETCPIRKTDKVVPNNNLIYDIGWALIEPTTGTTIEKHSYIIREIFFGEIYKKMQSAYYANKIPQYFASIATGQHEVKSFFDVIKEIQETIERENVIAICAHNATFDLTAIRTTFKWLTGYDQIAFKNVEIWDSMKMWNCVQPKSYTKFCIENDYRTNHNPQRNRLTAEIIYRFLIQDIDFEESHTALKDVEIETEIVFACYRTHKPMKEKRVVYHACA